MHTHRHTQTQAHTHAHTHTHTYADASLYLGSINEVVVSCKHPESIIDIRLRLRPIRKTYPILGQVWRREVHLDQTQVHLGSGIKVHKLFLPGYLREGYWALCSPSCVYPFVVLLMCPPLPRYHQLPNSVTLCGLRSIKSALL